MDQWASGAQWCRKAAPTDDGKAVSDMLRPAQRSSSCLRDNLTEETGASWAFKLFPHTHTHASPNT